MSKITNKNLVGQPILTPVLSSVSIGIFRALVKDKDLLSASPLRRKRKRHSHTKIWCTLIAQLSVNISQRKTETKKGIFNNRRLER